MSILERKIQSLKRDGKQDHEIKTMLEKEHDPDEIDEALANLRYQKPYSQMPVFALIFSLLFFVPLLPLIGVLLGIMSLQRRKKDETMAYAAIFIGLISSIISIVWLGSLIALF